MKMKKKRVDGASAVVATILIGLFIDIQLCSAKINRESFPDGFVFGAASSAYQVITKAFVLWLMIFFLIHHLTPVTNVCQCQCVFCQWVSLNLKG